MSNILFLYWDFHLDGGYSTQIQNNFFEIPSKVARRPENSLHKIYNHKLFLITATVKIKNQNERYSLLKNVF